MGSTNSTANADDGFDETDTNLRSILFHPSGLSLTAFLYDQPSSTLPDDYWSILPNGSKSVYESYTDHYHRFLSNQKSKTDSSPDLNFSDQSERIWAKKLLQDANEYCASETDNSLIVEQGNDTPDSGSVDAIIYDKCRYKNKSIVSIIGFGLNNEDWWKTKHRVLQYLKKLLEDKPNMFQYDQAFLLSIITVDPIDRTHKEGAKRLKTQVGDPASRFGTFLCIKKDDKTIRTALLCRKQMSNLPEATGEFVKLFAALQFAVRTEGLLYSSCQNRYRYLGPNCSKFGNRLYRSFDARFRATGRCPDLYLNELVFHDNDKVHTVLELPDQPNGDNCYKFEHRSGENEYIKMNVLNRQNWLWEFRGKLLIISIPFRVGGHVAKRPIHFVPIINHLLDMHTNGLVHGDIRAYNMVLKLDQEPSDGWLIDFDVGGPVEAVEFPWHFKQLLTDGKRLGEADQPITFHHDWYALVNLMFDRYTWSIDVESWGPKKYNLFLEKKANIMSNFDVDSSLQKCNDSDTNASLLLELIQDSEDLGCTLEPVEDFKKELIRFNML